MLIVKLRVIRKKKSNCLKPVDAISLCSRATFKLADYEEEIVPCPLTTMMIMREVIRVTKSNLCPY